MSSKESGKDHDGAVRGPGMLDMLQNAEASILVLGRTGRGPTAGRM